jgi:hypothetical protein
VNPEEIEELFQQRLLTRVACVSRHEAGHAMLADALGVKIRRVSIAGLNNPELRPMAVCELIPPYPIFSAIVIALAGQAVDDTLTTEQQCQASWLEYETDQERLAECIPKDCPENARAYFWQRIHLLRGTWVANWVAQHRSAIVGFAEHLRMKTILTGAELDIALRDSWAGTKPNEAHLIAETKQIVEGTICLDASVAAPKDTDKS